MSQSTIGAGEPAGQREGDAVGTESDQQAILAEIAATELPDAVTEVTDAYHELVDERDRYLWRWLYRTIPEVRLNSVAADHRERVRRLKVALSVYVVIADDCAENVGDAATFTALGRIPTLGLTGDELAGGETAADAAAAALDAPDVDGGRVRAAATAWRVVEEGIQRAPRGAAFADLFRFDVRQTMAAMDYSRVVNDQVGVANRHEMATYAPHNMTMFPMATLDLMHSPSFDRADLPAVRETVWLAQRLGGIGNCVTTWERELEEGDVASELFVRAREQGVLDREELVAVARGSCPDDAAERIRGAGLESELLAEWRATYDALLARSGRAETVDLRAYVRGLRTVLRNHLAARGLK